MALKTELEQFAENYIGRPLTEHEKEQLLPFNEVPIPSYDEDAEVGGPVTPVGSAELTQVIEAIQKIKSFNNN